MNPTNFPGRKKQKQEEALVRNAERAKRSPQDQLRHLDSLFGEGNGASRERARLNLAIERAAQQAETEAQAKAHAEQVRRDKAEAKAAAKAAAQ